MFTLSSLPTSATPARKILYETLIVIGLMLILALTPLKGIAVFLPLIYFFVEARLRHRTWAELGFKPREFLRAVQRNWLWILLVGVVVQIVVIVGAQFFYPAFLEHVRSRVPLLDNLQLLTIIGALLVTTLIEEVTFRAFFQERLAWFVGTPTAILAAALLFGVMHIASGALFVVALDVGLVVLDGILYGIIFARGQNIFAAWFAHFLADVTGILFLLWWT
jgi:membrane protease YdiL (CAAX protease family)